MAFSKSLPLISGTRAVGLYQVCTTANTDYPVAIPEGATGVVLWFSAAAADNTVIRGRWGINDDITAITGLTGTDDNLGYFPPQAVEVTFRKTSGGDSPYTDSYLHLANSTALSVARGTWLFAEN